MKSIYLCFFLCSFFFANAQPGDVVAIRKAMLQKVNLAIENDPNNASLLWERIDLVFNLHIDLYTRAGNRAAYPYYILDDLDYLIANNSLVKYRDKEVSIAEYYFRRGQFYYLLGDVSYAIQDYEVALACKPSYKLKAQICLAIAAYYYNLDEQYSLENYKKALLYIDLVTPKEDLNKSYLHYSKIQYDQFERQKIQLLKASQETERLITYLQCIAKKHFQFYKMESEKSIRHQKNLSYSVRYSLRLGFDKLYEIATHYYEKGEYTKAKQLTEQIILLLPRNASGHIYETFAYGNYFLLLSKIYRTNMYQDIALEIDYMLEGFGDLTQGFTSQAKKFGNRVDELLQLYPNEPKLQLLKAIYLKKSKYGRRHQEAPQNILEFLTKSEQLGLQDYRIYYLRAIVFKEEKRYQEALEEIRKAAVAYVGNPNIYRLQLRLINECEISADEEIETTKLLIETSKKQEKVLVESIIEMIHRI